MVHFLCGRVTNSSSSLCTSIVACVHVGFVPLLICVCVCVCVHVCCAVLPCRGLRGEPLGPRPQGRGDRAGADHHDGAGPYPEQVGELPHGRLSPLHPEGPHPVVHEGKCLAPLPTHTHPPPPLQWSHHVCGL